MHLFDISSLSLSKAFTLSIASLSWLPTPERGPIAKQKGQFDWESIKPSSDFLEWHECFKDFECARLEVPLDWSNTSNPNKVVLAVTRLPATVKDDDPTFGGTIITNPGGPGGSGVDILRWFAKEMQRELDGEKHFEILSFDPRGVSATTPPASCFNDTIARQVSTVKVSAWGTIDMSTSSFNERFAWGKSFGKACSSNEEGRYPDGSNIHQFVSTALVVQDMLAIIDKRQDLHEILTERLQWTKDDKPQAVLQNAIEHKRVPLLNYWGFSYGTFLGNTFASMHPSRVGRMILDGVVDAPDYARTGWATNLQDTDKIWVQFPKYCYDVGSKCPLYKESDKSDADITKRIATFLEQLKENPIPVVNNGVTDIIRYADVRYQIVQSLYFPVYKFPQLADILAELMNGNTTYMTSLLSTVSLHDRHTPSLEDDPGITKPKRNNSWDQPFNQPFKPNRMEVGAAIHCGDGDSLLNRTKAEHKNYLNTLLAQSQIVGGPWAEAATQCLGWVPKLRPAEHNRFSGPFTSKLSDYDSRASPLLFIGNTVDAVTPLHNAHKMAKEHEGAVVLQQDTFGHCAGPLAPVKCTYDIAREFYTHGKLPKKGTLCEDPRRPWVD